MKIKEKGLTGKTAANRKDSMLTRPRGFNAFAEMAKGKGTPQAGEDKPKPEIWLEFMGSKLRVNEEDGGSVKADDVPHVKGSTLKFTGCGGDVFFKDIKVSQCYVTHCVCIKYTLDTETPHRPFPSSTLHRIRKRK